MQVQFPLPFALLRQQPPYNDRKKELGSPGSKICMIIQIYAIKLAWYMQWIQKLKLYYVLEKNLDHTREVLLCIRENLSHLSQT